MDRSASKARPGPPGISIRNGPVKDGDAMDIDSQPNGTAKRKSRSSIGQAVNYKDDSDRDGDAPLVGFFSRVEVVFLGDTELTRAGQTSKIQTQKGGDRQR